MSLPMLTTLGALVAAPALAQVSPWSVGVSQSVMHDNNLLRLGGGQVAPEGFSRADTVSTTSLQGSLDQGFGRQRLGASLSLRNSRYSGNSVFNNQGYTGYVGLDWSTINRISGNLSASANRSLSSFNSYEIGLLRQRNYENTRGVNASVSVGLVTQYSLEAGLGHREVTNTLDLPALQSRNFTQDSGTLGLRWRPSGATSMALQMRQVRGRYPKYRLVDGEFQPDTFRENGVDLIASLQASGASSFDFRLGNSHTRYDLNAQRNFSGVTGLLAWNWQPTGKLRTAVRLSRETGQDSYAVTVFTNVPGSSDNSRIVNLLRLEATYDYSAKVNFYSGWNILQRSIVQTIVNPLLPLNASGKDHINTLQLGARWTPTRTTSLGCEAAHEDRKASGQLTTSLSSFSFNCYGQLTLQP